MHFSLHHPQSTAGAVVINLKTGMMNITMEIIQNLSKVGILQFRQE